MHPLDRADWSGRCCRRLLWHPWLRRDMRWCRWVYCWRWLTRVVWPIHPWPRHVFGMLRGHGEIRRVSELLRGARLCLHVRRAGLRRLPTHRGEAESSDVLLEAQGSRRGVDVAQVPDVGSEAVDVREAEAAQRLACRARVLDVLLAWLRANRELESSGQALARARQGTCG